MDLQIIICTLAFAMFLAALQLAFGGSKLTKVSYFLTYLLTLDTLVLFAKIGALDALVTYNHDLIITLIFRPYIIF